MIFPMDGSGLQHWVTLNIISLLDNEGDDDAQRQGECMRVWLEFNWRREIMDEDATKDSGWLKKEEGK